MTRIEAPQSWKNPDAHLECALSSPWYRALVLLQDTLVKATTSFWDERGCSAAHLPITTGSISSPMGLGSDSRPVQVDLDGVPTYLADSMQFALEFACRLAPHGAYYLMPSFRGESWDSTHLSQFFHSEAELPGSLEDTQSTVEAYVRHLVRAFLHRNGEQVAELAGSTAHLEALLADEAPFTSITFDQAWETLRGRPDAVHTSPDGRWRNLTRVGERQLMDEFGEFLWVTHWDHLAVPFYQAYAADGTALNGDLLFGPGEVVGAGERHADSASLRRALQEHHVSECSYAWYLRMRELKPLRTAGFGLGVERFLMWLTQHDDIRDLPLLLRDNGHALSP
jgi:asparaginyl-tRNA synthetase